MTNLYLVFVERDGEKEIIGPQQTKADAVEVAEDVRQEEGVSAEVRWTATGPSGPALGGPSGPTGPSGPSLTGGDDGE
jgi:hypothetical protein